MAKVRNIKIDENPSYTKYYGGNVEIDGEKYNFTIIENYNSNIDHFDVSLEWVDKEPKKKLIIENKIMKKFDN